MTRRALEGFADGKSVESTTPRRAKTAHDVTADAMPQPRGGATAWVPEGAEAASRRRRMLVAVPAASVIVLGVIAALALGQQPQQAEVTNAIPAPQLTTPAPTASEEPAERPESNAANRSAEREEKPAALPKPAVLDSFKPDPTKTGTMYATETLNVRAEPSADAEKVGSISQGDAVDVTDSKDGSWQQVIVDDKTAWVSSEYLSSSRPSTSSPGGSSGSDGSDGSDGSGGSHQSPSGNCPTKEGLTSTAQNVLNQVCAKWGGSISAYGGLRPGDSGKHGSGQAVDFMISDSTVGWEVANYLRANASSLGVTEVIYAQKIWTTQRSSEGWRGMSDRGSATANHYDHVHVSV